MTAAGLIAEADESFKRCAWSRPVKGPPDSENPPAVPTPRVIKLPLGGEANMFTREQLTILYHCSHGELGRLLCRKMGPPPIRVDGQILWYCDEALEYQAQVMRTLERWRH